MKSFHTILHFNSTINFILDIALMTVISNANMDPYLNIYIERIYCGITKNGSSHEPKSMAAIR
jgi:hypothetical protein